MAMEGSEFDFFLKCTNFDLSTKTDTNLGLIFHQEKQSKMRKKKWEKVNKFFIWQLKLTQV